MYSVCFVHPNESLTIVDDQYSKYIDELTKKLFYVIENYEKYLPYTSNCNIAIYQIKLVKNLNTNKKIIKYLSKIMPMILKDHNQNKMQNILINYLEFCDDEGMTVLKLHDEIYNINNLNIKNELILNYDINNNDNVNINNYYKIIHTEPEIEYKKYYVVGRIYENYNIVDSYQIKKWYDNTSEAIESMLNVIKSFREPYTGSCKRIKSIDINCDYNIGIFEANIDENIDEYYSQYDVKITKPVNYQEIKYELNAEVKEKIQKYLEFYNLPNMNAGKLCIKLYGPAITQKDVDDRIDLVFNQKLKEFQEKLPQKINKECITVCVDNWNSDIEVSTYDIGDKIVKYYKEKGYYVGTLSGGSAINIIVFEKTLIDPLISKLKNMINNDKELKKLEIIKKEESKKSPYFSASNEILTKIKKQKQYVVDKFKIMNTELSEYALHFITDTLNLHSGWYKYFENLKMEEYYTLSNNSSNDTGSDSSNSSDSD